MVGPEPALVVERVAAMVATDWPTTDEDRRAWFASFGIPVEGRMVTEPERLLSRGRQYFSPPAADWPATGWHVHRDRFVGVSWFLWAQEDEDATRAAAESLRALFSAHWPAVDQHSDRVAGFTTLWEPGDCQVDFYFHAPRDHPRAGTVPGAVQLHIDHRGRAAELELEALIGDVLENTWDPIGVYTGPFELRPPEGEYDTYVGWIADRLHAGGGRTEILAELRRAREWMGLEHATRGDEEATQRILERWREHLAKR